jgi:hypothetical protein
MRKTKSFESVSRQYFYPEMKRCPHCHKRLCLLQGLYLKKTIQTLDGVLWLGGYASHCVNPNCQSHQTHYLSSQLAALSLPGVTYGLDVIVRVGWRRQHDHRTMSEIGQELRACRMQITDREVERLWDYYRLLLRGLSQADMAKLREAEQAYGGLIWSADGLQPESGEPQLWVVREVLTRLVVRAEWLSQIDQPTLAAFLQPVKALGLKTLATVSDQQRALVKALKATWRKPHQACQSHFLRDAAAPLIERDRARMVEIKEKIRGIRAIERQIEAAGALDQSAGIVGMYALAIRQGLRFRSRAPLQLGGVRLYALLDELTCSIQRCLKKGTMSVSPNCSASSSQCEMNFALRWKDSVKVSNG